MRALLRATPRVSDGRVDVALDDAQLRELGEARQAGPPHSVLKGSLRDDGHTACEQQLQRAEEERERSLGQRVARFGTELAGVRVK